MPLILYNSLTKKKQAFAPLNRGKVSIYNCGPTVYNYPHIGNLRRYIMSDILQRYLEYSGYEVKNITNITDVGHLTDDEWERGEDKIIKKAREEKKSPLDVAKFYTEKFFEDIDKLAIKRAHYYPPASKHIPEIIEAVKILLKKSCAYETETGIYFSVEKFPKYGQLSGNTLEQLKEGARVEVREEKKHPADFALWIKAPKEHLLQWGSPWGKGYPGWHIECSVMSRKYLGDTLDIHTGGEDNIFPHHEDEIAQSESLTGQKFVNFWIHSRHLLLGDKKMAKRESGFLRLKDIEEKFFSPLDFRMLVLASLYRSHLSFTWQALEQAQKNRQRLNGFLNRLGEIKSNDEDDIEVLEKIDQLKDNFAKAMDDDLNTPLALSKIFQFITDINKIIDIEKINQKEANKIKSLLGKFDRVLAIIEEKKDKIPAEIIALAEKREKARQEKDFRKADELRKKILEKGYEIEDASSGYKLKKL